MTEIKASYRRLARQYHPDVNPEDRQAHDKFIEVTEAYKFLLSVVPPDETKSHQESAAFWYQPQVTKVTRKPSPPMQKPVQLSEVEQQLKWNAYEQLQQMLKSRKFALAIALVEGLAQRFPQDLEVRQWQAIAYSSWGRQLVGENQLDKARIYLKKALRTDPHNRSLWAEVEKDFRRIEQRL
jgi:curved DNA-binding protein CbpA